MRLRDEMDEYRSDEELYVYDQSCRNCRYGKHCGRSGNKDVVVCGKHFNDNEKSRASDWCAGWKGLRR